MGLSGSSGTVGRGSGSDGVSGRGMARTRCSNSSNWAATALLCSSKLASMQGGRAGNGRFVRFSTGIAATPSTDEAPGGREYPWSCTCCAACSIWFLCEHSAVCRPWSANTRLWELANNADSCSWFTLFCMCNKLMSACSYYLQQLYARTGECTVDFTLDSSTSAAANAQFWYASMHAWTLERCALRTAISDLMPSEFFCASSDSILSKSLALFIRLSGFTMPPVSETLPSPSETDNVDISKPKVIIAAPMGVELQG
jgi:hypothetical protein